MRTTSFLAISLLTLGAGSSLGCGPGRLSDADVTRLCELQVRCSGGAVSQASCEASSRAERDATNASGCGGQLGAAARCVIRADECTVPASCADEQMRLSTCLSRPRTDSGPTTTDASTTTCSPQSFEEGFEACTDGCDNDGDIAYDCNDDGCCGSVECGAGTLCGGGSCAPVPETSYDACTDGCDNDGDTVFDCNDDGCCETRSGECGAGTFCGTIECTPGPEEGFAACTDGCDNDGDVSFDCNDSACCPSLEGSCSTGTLCGGSSVPSELRMTNGFLEVYYMSEWRSVCDDGFDMSDANVACRQLGFSGAESFETSVSGTNELFWLDDLACAGTEATLGDCPSSGWGVENCSASESVAVLCF